jgi:hypothetical protein
MRGDAGILFALFVIALSASLPVGALYWLMRPMALPNPGISAYQAPRSDPTIPRVPSGVDESYALSITAAKRENERLHGKSRSGFAAAAKPAARALAWLCFSRRGSAVRASNGLNLHCPLCMSPQVIPGHSGIMSLGSGIANALG